MDDLRHAPAGVDGIEHAAAPPDAHQHFKPAVGIHAQHADTVAGAHAQRAQGASHARDAVTEFAKVLAPAVKYRGGLFGRGLDRAPQSEGHGHGAKLSINALAFERRQRLAVSTKP
ncbi:hypothetical protein D3C78_1343660 [compost metagenome]